MPIHETTSLSVPVSIYGDGLVDHLLEPWWVVDLAA